MKSQIFNVHPIFELAKSLPVADFTAGDLTMTHQMRRGESGRKLCKNPMKSIQPSILPSKNTLLSSRDIPCFLHASTPFDSSFPSLFSLPPFPTKPQLPCFSIPCSKSPNQSRAPLFPGQQFLLQFFLLPVQQQCQR